MLTRALRSRARPADAGPGAADAGREARPADLRTSLVGAVARGPGTRRRGDGLRRPRFLVRVDEFPIYSGLDDARYGCGASEAFHATMAAAQLPYLMAVVPQWTHAPLNPVGRGARSRRGDRELIARMRADGVTFAQHGETHRSALRRPAASLRAERPETQRLPAARSRPPATGRRRLSDARVRRPVQPLRRRQWPVLAERYDVITGGPETVSEAGFQGGPAWRGDAVYLPCYAPLYGRAATVLPAAERLIAAGREHVGADRAARGLGGGRRIRRPEAAGRADRRARVSWERLLAARRRKPP